MTIDERLEALVQSVELLTQDVRELQVATKQLQGFAQRTGAFVNEIAEGTVRLLRAVESHE